MNQRVDFSRNASVYDRRHGSSLPEDIVQRLAVTAKLQPGVKVLDVGAGTGRVAIALADFGCDVVAMEPAHGMVEELRAKANLTALSTVAGDGTQLPVASTSFDVIVIARLLYLVPDWRAVLREARRVLLPGGRLLHEWANGQTDEDWVQVRERTRHLFQQAGIKEPFHPGVRSEVDVDHYLETLGFVHIDDVSAGPGPNLTLAEFVERIVTGELSYTWEVPREVQEDCLPRLQQWARETFDLDSAALMPRDLKWAVFRLDAD